MISFASLKAAYPKMPKPELFNALGGEWPRLIDNDVYKNTCAIRLSHAFNQAGQAVPNYHEGLDGSGANIIVKVKTMDLFVESLLGKPYWGMSKPPNTPIAPKDIPAVQGIIAYHAAWADATGHFDLWTGAGFVGAGDFDDVAEGFDIALWAMRRRMKN